MSFASGRTIVGSLALGVLSAAAALAAAAPPPAVAPPAGSSRVRLVRSWPEDALVRGRRVPARVEMWLDYDSGRVTERVILADGKGGARIQKSHTWPRGINVPRPSPDEIAEAMALVRADEELASIIGGSRAQLDGGFEIFEPVGSPCEPGTRCLKIQVMTENRQGVIRNVVVDLTRQAIVYRSWAPEGAWGKK